MMRNEHNATVIEDDYGPCKTADDYPEPHRDGRHHWPLWSRWNAPKLPKWGTRPPPARGKARHRRGRK